MATIDERVVKMEFDNKAFEKNASQTMSTLDKLKELLKFDKVKGSFEQITKSANKVDVSNVSDGIETVNAKFSAMQVVSATAISKVTSSLMGFGKRVVAGTFGQVIQGGIRRAFNIEQAKFTIEGLGKDFTQLQEDINYAVNGTAYGFDEAAKAASMMAASGIEAGDQMKASLRGISGMAAMTGDSYSNIADIFGNIAGKGKLSLQEVNRFATRGINVAAELAKQMKMTEQEVRDMVSKGEISFQEFAQAMDDAFGEHATAANKTFNGVMDNIKATLSRVGAAFIQPLITTNERDAALIETYKKFDDRLIDVAKDAHATTEGTVKARAAITSLLKENDKYALHNTDMVSNLIKGNEKAYLSALKKTYEIGDYSKEELHKMYLEDQKFLKKTLANSEEYAGASSEEIRKIFNDDKENFIDAVRQIPKYANASEKDLDRMYRKYHDLQFNIVTVLQAVKRFLGTIETAIKGSSFLQGFLDLVSKASRALSLFFNAAAASFTDLNNAENQFIEVSGKVVHTLTSTELWEKFGKVVGLGDQELQNLLDTFEGIRSIIRLVADAIGAIVKAISPIISGVFKNALSIILAITGTIGRLITSFYEFVDSTQILQNVAQVFHDVFAGIFGVITFFVKIVTDAFSMITNNPVFYAIINLLKTIGNEFNTLFNAVYDVISKIIFWFTLPFREAGLMAEGTGNLVTNVLGAVADALWLLDDALVKAIDFVNSFIDNFVDLDKVIGVGKKLAKFFKSGFSLDNLFGEKENTTAGMFDTTVSGMEEESGGFIGIIDGILSTIKNNISKIDFNGIAKILSKGFKTIGDVLATGVGIIVLAFDTLLQAINTIDFQAIGKTVGNWISKLLGSLTPIFEKIPLTLDDLFKAIIVSLPDLKPSADKIGQSLGEMLASGIELIFSAVPLIIRIIWSALKAINIRLPGILNKFAYEMKDIFGLKIAETFAKVKEVLSKVTFADILRVLNLAALLEILNQIVGIFKKIKQALGLPAALTTFLNGIKKAANTVAKATAIKQLAIALILIVGALAIISFIPYERIIDGLIKMTLAAAFLIIFIRQLNKALKDTPDGKDLYKFIAVIDSFVFALTVLIGALAILALIKDSGKAVGQFIIIVAAIGAFIAIMDKLKIDTERFTNLTVAMILFSKAMVAMSVGMLILSLANPGKLVVNAILLSAVIGAIVLAAKYAEGSTEAIKALAKLGPMILMMSAGLAILALFDWQSVIAGAFAIGIVIAALVGGSALIAKVPMAAAALTTLSTAILMLGASVLAVGAGVYLFVSALQTLSMLGRDGGIESLKTAFQGLADSAVILGQGIGQIILVIAQTLSDGATIIADALLNIVKSCLTRLLEAATMFVEVGLKIITMLLQGIMDNISYITNAVLVIITNFVSGVAANIGPVIEAGMNLMLNFINGMADSIRTNSTAIWAAVGNLMSSIIELIISGLQIIVENVPLVGDQISSGLEKATKATNQFFNKGDISKGADKEMKGASKAIDSETKKAANSSKKNLSGVSKEAKKSAKETKGAYKGTGTSIVKEFDKIPEGAGKISDKMPKLGKETIKAYGDSFKKNAKEADGKKAGEKIADGTKKVNMSDSAKQMFDGFSDSFLGKDWYGKGAAAAREVNRGFRETEDIESPSKVWAGYAGYLYTGLANRMNKFTHNFYSIGSGAAEEVNSGFGSSMNLLSDMGFSDIAEPTIRPVLDLTNIQNGANKISSMFNSGSYALGLAGSMALGANGRMYSGEPSRNVTFNNNITVDGAEDPAKWADEFAHELEIQARTR